MPRLTGERLSSYTLTLALGLSALGAGAIHLPILAPFAMLVISSAAFLARSRTRAGAPQWIDLRTAVGAGVWFALAGFSLLQCLPLPAGLLEHLAPDNADIWARALRPFGLPAPAGSISLAPGRTVLEALKAATYGLVFVVSARLARRYGLERVATIGFALPLVVALVTAAHRLSGAERLYGTYQLLDAYSVAPLLNANSRAGYLNLGFFCGLGLLLRAGARPRGALLGLLLTFLAAEVVMCESRGGTGCLILGLLLLLVAPGAAKSSEFGRLLQLGILTAIGAGASLLAWLARRSPLGLDDSSLSKLDLCERAWRVAVDHFPVGVGRGAFASVFGAYQGTGQPLIAEHVENFPLQWAAEWGLPVTLLALASFAWVLQPVLVSGHAWSTPTHRGVLAGCGVLLLQNLVDLGLELPAVAALLAGLLGGLQGSFVEARSATRGPTLRQVLVAGTIVSVVCLGLTLKFGVTAPGRLRRELHDELAATPSAPPTSFWTHLQGAMRAYPAEPYFPLLGASAALAEGKDALPWITRALERNPTSAEAYFELARILHARGATNQALGAFARSIELQPERAPRALLLGKAWGVSTAALAAAVVPAGAAGAEVLILLAYQTQDFALRVQLLEQALERRPELSDAHQRLATELLDDAQRGAAGAVCAAQRDTCLLRALDHARRGSQPGSSHAAVLQARIRTAQQQPGEAEEQLAQACQDFPMDVACNDALVDLALRNSSERLPDAVRRLVAVACVDRERCAKAQLNLGRKFAAAGRFNVALSHYEQAAKELPSVDTWGAVASTAQQLGQRTLADDALRRVRVLEAAAAPESPPKVPLPAGAQLLEHEVEPAND